MVIIWNVSHYYKVNANIRSMIRLKVMICTVKEHKLYCQVGVNNTLLALILNRWNGRVNQSKGMILLITVSLLQIKFLV